jgi:predicted alpha/beta-fold hydrolase
MNRLARFYHSGDTADAAHAIVLIRRRFPGRSLGAVGFSMGGNVLLKHLGECGQADRSDAEVEAAVAISVPFDLTAGIDTIERGLGRLYQLYFLRRLRRKLALKGDVLREEVDLDRLLRVRTLRAFDDLGTAPLHDFLDSADYYRRASCRPYLEAIRVPTLLIHAEDDPFQPPDALPHQEVASNPALEAMFTSTGGHVGFVSGPPWAPRFWAESTAAEFLADHLSAGG